MIRYAFTGLTRQTASTANSFWNQISNCYLQQSHFISADSYMCTRLLGVVVIISFLTLPTLSVSQSVLLASNVDFKSKCLSDFIGVKGSTPRMCSIYKSIIANKRQQRFSELFATFPTLGKMGHDQIVMLTNWITLTLISCIRTNWDSGWDSGILLGLMYLNIDESKVVLYLSFQMSI